MARLQLALVRGRLGGTADIPNEFQAAVPRLHVLYHELHPESRDYTYGMQTSRFAEHLALFAQLDSAETGPRPEVTFDDGHVSNYEQALPLLQQSNRTAWFFLTAGWIEQREDYLNWRQVRALHDAGNRIAAHGWSHALLTHCNAAELRRELRDARDLLQDRLGAPVTALSFPGGRYNTRVLEACREAGYTQMFTSHPQTSLPEQTGLIGRLNLRSDTTVEWLRRLFAADGDLLMSLQRQDRIKSTLKGLLGDRAYAALWRVINRAGAEA